MADRVQRNLLNLLRNVTPRQVLEIEVVEGAGVEGNCLRPVKYFLDANSGEVLARVDVEPTQKAEVFVSLGR